MRASLRFVAWGALALGCSSSGSSSGTTADAGAIVQPHACDPLAVGDTPVTLANLLGAGRHADGTVYVVDDGGRDHQRAFISTDANTLQRYKIAGSGSAEGWLSLTIDQPQVSIRIDNPGPNPTKMSVKRGALAAGDKIPDPQTSDSLTLIASSELAHYVLKNVPGNVFVEYNATVADGRHLFVTRPDVDWSYEDFRVFFGPADNLRERTLVSASRGNTTWITFDVDGVKYQAVIPAPPPLDPPDAKATLTPEGQAAMTLTILATDASARAGLSFVCIK